MRYKKSLAYLPSQINKIIEKSELTKLQKNRATSIVCLIFRNLIEECLSLEDWVEIPSSYWKKSIAWHYEIPMEFLINENVIIRPFSYSSFKNQCMRYKINPNMLDDEFISIWYVDENKRKPEDSMVCKKTRKILRECIINKAEALKFVDRYVNSSEIENKLRYNEDVKDGWLKDVRYKIWNGSRSKIDTHKALALQMAKINNLTLIQDDKKFVISDREEYLKLKRSYVKFCYENSILKLFEKDIYAKRNDTNRRLDSNITTMPSVLIPFITLDGERLINIDLKNSQFVMLAVLIENGFFDEFIEAAKSKITSNSLQKLNMPQSTFSTLYYENKGKKVINGGVVKEKGIISNMEIKFIKEEVYMCADGNSINPYKELVYNDLELFVSLAKSGKLYDFIRDELRIGFGDIGRKKAKQIMFEIFFSNHKANSPEKGKVKKLFPTLIKMIDLFKKKKGDKEFAIALQKKESSIFINKVLTRLYKSGYKVLSKHDSILCRKSDQDAVKTIMMQILDKEIGMNQYQLKLE